MSLLDLILGLIAIGVALYAINRFVPMDPNIRNLLNVGVILIVLIWMLNGLGVFHWMERIRS